MPAPLITSSITTLEEVQFALNWGKDVHVPQGEHIHLTANAALTVPTGMTFLIAGTVTNRGAIANDGAIRITIAF